MRYGHKFITPLRGGVFVTTSAAVNQQGGEKNHSTASDSAQSLANLHSECVCVYMRAPSNHKSICHQILKLGYLFFLIQLLKLEQISLIRNKEQANSSIHYPLHIYLIHFVGLGLTHVCACAIYLYL